MQNAKKPNLSFTNEADEKIKLGKIIKPVAAVVAKVAPIAGALGVPGAAIAGAVAGQIAKKK